MELLSPLFRLSNYRFKARVIISFALLDFELYHIDLEKVFKKILENLNKLFGAKAVNENFSLKLYLFNFKMANGVTMSRNLSNLRSFI